MSIQDIAVTPKQHSVNTEVIIREEPGTNSSTSRKDMGSPGQKQKDGGILLSHKTTVQANPEEPFSWNLPTRWSPGLPHSVSSLRKEASWPQRSKSPSKDSIPVAETQKCRLRLGGKATGLLANVLCTHRKPGTSFRGRLTLLGEGARFEDKSTHN